MADAPWRCSQCGTVNEPVANACRTCGHWPSLFDLESSKVDTGTGATTVEADPFAARSIDVERIEPEIFDPDQAGAPEPVELPPEFDATEDDEDAGAAPKPRWQRLVSLLVPLAVVAYVLITAFLDR